MGGKDNLSIVVQTATRRLEESDATSLPRTTGGPHLPVNVLREVVAGVELQPNAAVQHCRTHSAVVLGLGLEQGNGGIYC